MIETRLSFIELFRMKIPKGTFNYDFLSEFSDSLKNSNPEKTATDKSFSRPGNILVRIYMALEANTYHLSLCS